MVVGSRAHLVNSEAVVKVSGHLVKAKTRSSTCVEEQTPQYADARIPPLFADTGSGWHQGYTMWIQGKSFLYNHNLSDSDIPTQLFTRSTAQLLFPPLHLLRWSFDVELLLLASLTLPSIPVLEVPVAWHEVNGSKIRLGWDSLGMARDLLVLRANLAIGRWKVPERPVMDRSGMRDNGEVK
jgi:hypothetical protein